jgi:rare lipoprotein A
MNLCSILLVFLLSFNATTTAFVAGGKASYYADRFHGKRTSSGESYDKNLMTAAHVSLPFNTYVKVTNERNGKSVVVKINDRMAKKRAAIIDLSKAAAAEIDMIRDGVVSVTIEVVNKPEEGQQEPQFIVSEKATVMKK